MENLSKIVPYPASKGPAPPPFQLTFSPCWMQELMPFFPVFRSRSRPPQCRGNKQKFIEQNYRAWTSGHWQSKVSCIFFYFMNMLTKLKLKFFLIIYLFINVIRVIRDLERTVNSSRAEKEDLTRDLCEVRIQLLSGLRIHVIICGYWYWFDFYLKNPALYPQIV